jgi:hypothetical protein
MLARLAAAVGRGYLPGMADPAAEPFVARLPDRAVLRLEGPDTRGLLQGLVSNDVTRLAPGRAIHAALLTPQGKWLFDFVMLDAGDAVLLDAERARLGELRQRLLMYRLRARVEIEPAEALVVAAAVAGPARFGLPGEPGACRRRGGLLVAVDPRAAALGLRLVGPEAEVEAWRAASGLPSGPEAAYHRHRIALAVPDGARDLVPGRSLLLESNFEELHGVDFAKGCFVGQELTARTKHRALVKKRLLPVRVDGPLPAPGTPLTRSGREAGELRSGSGDLALALLRLDQLGADDAPLLAGDSVLTPAPPPWLAHVLAARLPPPAD